MKFNLGVTDNHWYEYLSQINPEDINFWQPGGGQQFRILAPGEPFLFKLKSPINKIAGVGFFSSHSFLPLSVAWSTFGNRNGCSSFGDFQKTIQAYKKDWKNNNPVIGCIVLTNPIFFNREDWLPTPSDFSPSIVQGKSYSTETPIGKEVWRKIDIVLSKYFSNQIIINKEESFIVAEPDSPLYGFSYLNKIRIGQGAFRVSVINAYNKRCAFTGEKTLPVLEAGHIKPYSQAGPNLSSNGILMRSDIHTLFDCGYITLNSEYRIEVSGRIKEEFENGKEYYKFHGEALKVLPQLLHERPNTEFIQWHNERIYVG